MSSIRKQAIFSSIVIYMGFAVGALNTYLFTKKGLFTAEQYGLIGIFVSLASLIMAVGTLGSTSYLYKFFPYYHDHLPDKKNDLLAWTLSATSLGFLLVTIAGISMKWLVVRKFIEQSPLILEYYYWILPFGAGLLFYSVLEVYTWRYKKSILTNYLKEAQWRLLVLLLIVLYMTGVIPSFSGFIEAYSFTYLVVAIILIVYLVRTNRFQLYFSVSKVTRRLYRKIIVFCSFAYTGSIIFMMAQVIDSLIIASVLEKGLEKVAVFTLGQYVASLVQAPQRSMIAATVFPLSQAWKDKKMGEIQRIYQRSALNQLIFAFPLFLLVYMNYRDAVFTFGLKETYLQSMMVFFYLGITKVVDMGTGVNSQIIGTSNRWRFEFFSGMILLISIVPLTYLFTKQMGIVGTAISNLLAICLYNAIRIIFLWSKFKLHPFSKNIFLAAAVAAVAGAIAWFLFRNVHGFPGHFGRSILFLALCIPAIVAMKLSPDITSIWGKWKEKF